MKNRKQKQLLYNQTYSEIPRDYNERLLYMIDKYHISESQMDQIIYRKRNIEERLYFIDYVLILYEEPEGTPRPRFRIINKANYMDAAIASPNFVHVYQPNAADDFRYMQKLGEQDLLNLHQFVQTPCNITIDCFFKLPSDYSVSDKILAEYGLDWSIRKPDWDNIGKKYSDMYNTNVWLDDNLVISGTVNKFYSILPRVEIYLKYLNLAPNKKHYNAIVSKKNYNEEYPIRYLDNNGYIGGK